MGTGTVVGRTLRVGLVGAGAMGSIIARAVGLGEVRAALTGVADLEPERARAAAAESGAGVIVGTIPEVAEVADLLVEAAGAGVVRPVLEAAARRGRDVVILSVGGLLDLGDTIAEAMDAGVHVYCPSGAIAGLDAVKAAGGGEIRTARLTTRKPPAGLAGAPYLDERGIDVSALETPVTVFEGTAREACRAFPANINVSAALSLAGIGADRTEVRLIADPTIQRNIHEIEVTGDFGVIRTVTENVPSENPRTSRLAALSAIALLKGLTGSPRVGT